MTYKLEIRHYHANSNDARYATIFLSLLFLNTLGVALNVTQPLLSMVNMILGVVFLIVLLTRILKRSKVPFLIIHDNSLEYFCQDAGLIISIPAMEITKITTKFSELNIHTDNREHSLNLGLIRQHKIRWEIKEMIREMVRTKGNRTVIA